MAAPSFAPPPLPIPASIGDYQIVCRLASGGMAEVFLASRHGAHGFARPVVIKRMLPHLAADAELYGAIVDEAGVLARIRHPNVVHVEELGSDGTTYYLVLEYLRGDSLSTLLRRLRVRGERLEPALAAHIVCEASAGIHASHELCDDDGRPLGVVHRDISPHNVFATFEGEVKVIDFGIARFDQRAGARTKTGVAKGKFAYMAPEQFSGAAVDRRADVFALGALLHELLTGERLFARDSDVQVLRAILDDPIAPPSERCPAIPASLDAVCLRALARDPGERYATADALREALHELMPIVDPRQRARGEVAALMRRVLADRWAETEELLLRARMPLTARESTPAAPGAPRGDGSELVTVSRVAAAQAREPAGSSELGSISIAVAPPRTRGEPTEKMRAVPAPSRTRGWALVLGACLSAGVIATGAVVLVAGVQTPQPPAPEITAAALPPAPTTLAPAPAPVPVPTVAPEVVAPATVRIRIESIPIGAAVRDAERVLGTTPLELDLVPATPRELTLERAGYLPVRRQVVPAAGAVVRVRLARRPPRAPQRETAPRFYSFDQPQGEAPPAPR